MMKRKKRLAVCLIALLLAALPALFLSILFPPAADQDYAERFLTRNESILSGLIEAAEGSYLPAGRSVFFSLNRLISIDGRAENGVVSFLFHSPYAEGFTALYYCPDGAVPAALTWYSLETGEKESVRSLSEIPPGGLRIEKLGANGKGHFYCIMLRPGWCFVDAFLPT